MDHPKIRKDDDNNLWLGFGSYGDEVEVAAISGDGRRILTVREVDTAMIWDVDSGELLATFVPASPLEGKTDSSPTADEFKVFIESASLNSDGRFALLGLNDGTAAIFEVENAEEQPVVLHPPDETPGEDWGVIRAVEYSSNDLAIVGFPGRRVGVWSSDGSESVAFLDPKMTQIFGTPFVRDTLTSSISLSSDGDYVFAGAVDMTALIFELKTGQVVFQATMHSEDIVEIFDNGSDMGWATTAGNVWIKRPGESLELCLQAGELWEEVCFESDSGRLIARGLDGSVAIWELNGQKHSLQSPSKRGLNPKQSLALCQDIAHFPVGSQNICVQSEENSIVINRNDRVIRAILAPNRNQIGIDGWADEVGLWDTVTGELVRNFPAAGGSGCFAFSPDSELIAIGEIGNGGGLYPRHVYVYEISSGKLIHRLTEHEWQIKSVAFSPDGKFLASLGDDLIVWDLSDVYFPVIQERIGRSTKGIEFVGDDLVTITEGQIQVFAEGQKRLSFDVEFGYDSRWKISSDQRHILISGKQQLFKYSLATGELVEWIEADIPRYEMFPSRKTRVQYKVTEGAALWKTEFGVFVHQSDGPRGWKQPLNLTQEGVALPCESGAVVLSGDANTVLGTIPFEGKLRAGRIASGVSFLVNEKGHLYRNPIPSDLSSQES